MDVKKIVVEDFRSHHKIEVELGKVTLITGPNGSGKSSIAEAPITMLTGDNTWTARNGINLASQIRKGAKQAKLTLVGRRAISRIVTPKVSRLVMDDKDPLTQPLLLKNLKVTAPQARAALCPHSFLSLDLKEMKEVLFDLLSSEITLDTVGKFVPGEADPTWKRLRKRWEEDHPDEKTVDLDALYKWVYEARRSYKAKKTAPTTDDPRRKELEAKRSDLDRSIAGANFDNGRIEVGKKMRASIPDLEERLSVMAESAPDLERLKKGIEDVEGEILELEKQLAGIEALDRQNETELELFGDTKVKNGKVSCPIGLDCPHDEKVLKGRKNLLQGQKVARSGQKKSVQEKIRDARARKMKATEEYQKSSTVARDYKDLQDELRRAKEVPDEEYIDIEPMKAEKARVQAELDKLISKPSDADPTVDHLNSIVETLNVNGIKTEVLRKEVTQLEKDLNEALARFGSWSIRFFVEGEFEPTILTKEGECRVGEMSDGERALLSLVVQDAFSKRTGMNLVVIDNVDLLDPKVTVRFFEAAVAVSSKVVVAMANAPQHPLPKEVRVVTLGASEKSEQATESGDKPPIEDLL